MSSWRVCSQVKSQVPFDWPFHEGEGFTFILHIPDCTKHTCGNSNHMWNYCYTFYVFVLQSFHTSTTLISPKCCLTKYIIHPTKYSHYFTDEISEPQREEINFIKFQQWCLPFLFNRSFLLSSLSSFSLPASLPPFMIHFLSSYGMPGILNSSIDDSTGLPVPFLFLAILFTLKQHKIITLPGNQKLGWDLSQKQRRSHHHVCNWSPPEDISS